MPDRIRAQRKHAQEAKQKREGQLQSRQDAVDLLRAGGSSIRKVAGRTGVRKSIVGQLSRCLTMNSSIELQRLLHPDLHHQGRRGVLSSLEEQMIVERMNFASRRGFAFDVDDLSMVMARIASDGRDSWKNGVPSSDVVRAFRAKHPDVCLRTHTRKDAAKLRAEDREHLRSYKEILQEVDKLHPGMLQDPCRFWNTDETAVLTEKGRKRKVFGPSSAHQGGFVTQQVGSGEGRHVTAVIAVSAAGHKAPPFLLSRENVEKGSMTALVLERFLKHLNDYVRTIVPEGVPYCVSLDGHKSRCGIEWLEFCSKNKVEVIQAPANTSHFLQPCDADVNKNHKKNIRSVRDALCKRALVDTKTIGFKLICGVKAWERISINDVKKSFESTGMWPVDYRFMSFFPPPQRDEPTNSSNEQEHGPRSADVETLSKLKTLINSNMPPERVLQNVAIELSRNPTTNAILMQHQKPGTFSSRSVSRNFVLSAGAPAEALTVGEAIEKRRKKIQEEDIKKKERQKRKEDRQLKSTRKLQAKGSSKSGS
eukprot:IDg3025t1